MKRNTVVYIHRRKDTGEVFYVGIGNRYRPKCKDYRNNYWWNILNKHGYTVEIVKTDLTWDEACEEEIRLIKHYGRKDLGLGTLVNMTDGGDGAKGVKWSDERIEKRRNQSIKFYENEENRIRWSILTKGEKNGFFGKKHTDLVKSKISKTKKMLNQSTGENNGRATLTKEEVLWIRNNGVKGKGGNVLKLSKKYGLHRGTIIKIINRKSWTHI